MPKTKKEQYSRNNQFTTILADVRNFWQESIKIILLQFMEVSNKWMPKIVKKVTFLK